MVLKDICVFAETLRFKLQGELLQRSQKLLLLLRRRPGGRQRQVRRHRFTIWTQFYGNIRDNKERHETTNTVFVLLRLNGSWMNLNETFHPLKTDVTRLTVKQKLHKKLLKWFVSDPGRRVRLAAWRQPQRATPRCRPPWPPSSAWTASWRGRMAWTSGQLQRENISCHTCVCFRFNPTRRCLVGKLRIKQQSSQQWSSFKNRCQKSHPFFFFSEIFLLISQRIIHGSWWKQKNPACLRDLYLRACAIWWRFK